VFSTCVVRLIDPVETVPEFVKKESRESTPVFSTCIAPLIGPVEMVPVFMMVIWPAATEVISSVVSSCMAHIATGFRFTLRHISVYGLERVMNSSSYTHWSYNILIRYRYLNSGTDASTALGS